jgi:molybdopterin synthase catalytic subunit
MAQVAQGPGWFVEVTPLPLTAQPYIDNVVDPAAGAVSSFIGTTRNTFQGKAVLRLEYEAYVPMAIAKLQVSTVHATMESRHNHLASFVGP